MKLRVQIRFSTHVHLNPIFRTNLHQKIDYDVPSIAIVLQRKLKCYLAHAAPMMGRRAWQHFLYRRALRLTVISLLNSDYESLTTVIHKLYDYYVQLHLFYD